VSVANRSAGTREGRADLMTARCAGTTNPVEPVTASVIPAQKDAGGPSPRKRSLMLDESASRDCIEARTCE